MTTATLDEIAILEGTDKSTVEHGYTRHYEPAFERFRDEPIELLEIGVANGSSLRMWEKFFSRATLIGVDIIPGCVRCAGGRKHVEIGSQDDVVFLQKLVEKYHPKIIIDDGSHQADHIRLTIEQLFPALLPGGCYVIEDLHFHNHPTDRDVPFGALKMVNDLGFRTVMSRPGDANSPDALTRIAYTIDRIEFVRHAVLIWKKVPDPNPPRTIATMKALIETSGSGDNWFNFVHFLQDNGGSLDEAETAARNAIRLGANPSLSHWRLSEVLEARGDTQGALAAAEQAFVHDPRNSHIGSLVDRLSQSVRGT